MYKLFLLLFTSDILLAVCPETEKTQLLKASKRDSQFQSYLLAIIQVESGFNSWAVSHKGAMGLMQLTEPAIQDAATYCKLPRKVENIFDDKTNILYGSCYLARLLSLSEGDWTATLVAYNGGFRALTKYMKGETIHSETANYVLKVERVRKLCTTKGLGK